LMYPAVSGSVYRPDAGHRHSSASIGGVNPFECPGYHGPRGHLRGASAPKSAGHQWPLSRLSRLRQPVLVEDCRSIIAGYPIRVWDELPTKALVIPIAHDSE
jgi:hypothetical protein